MDIRARKMELNFDIDSEVLISMVKNRPVLWDKTIPEYNLKSATLKAWMEICQVFKKDYDSLNEADKFVVGKIVIKKWGNIRDNYIKCRRKLLEKNNPNRPRKYVFYTRLQFLNKVLSHGRGQKIDEIDTEPEDDLVSGNRKIQKREEIDTEPEEDPETANVRDPIKVEEDSSDYSTNEESLNFITADMSNEIKDLTPTTSKKRKLDEKTETIVKVVTEKDNRHISFMKGILPSLEDFSEKEVLQFQCAVLNTIQSIIQTREPSSYYE